jgi:hypothetical protein
MVIGFISASFPLTKKILKHDDDRPNPMHDADPMTIGFIQHLSFLSTTQIKRS